MFLFYLVIFIGRGYNLFLAAISRFQLQNGMLLDFTVGFEE